MHKLNFTSFALLALEMQTQHHFAVTSRKRSSPERLLHFEAVNVTEKEIFINLGIKFIYMRSLFKPLTCRTTSEALYFVRPSTDHPDMLLKTPVYYRQINIFICLFSFYFLTYNLNLELFAEIAKQRKPA